MERTDIKKTGRGLSLTGLFLRYLLASGLACLGLAALWWLAVSLLVDGGAVLRADAGARVWQQAQQLLPAADAGSFTPDLTPYPLDYVLYTVEPGFPAGAAGAPAGDGPAQPGVYAGRAYSGADLTVTVRATSLSGGQLARWLSGESPRRSLYSQLSGTVQLADGTLCTAFYDYAAVYASPALQRLLPDFQLTALAALVLGCLGAVALLARRYARLLRADAALLARAAGRIAARDVSAPLPTGARVREFCQALETMEGLRGQLSAALAGQWAMEQQRARSIAALAHDLKTPLTVIGGNAELLAEDNLTGAQRQEVEAILRSAESAGDYLARLRAVSAGEDAPASVQTVALAALLEEAARQGQAICALRGAAFTLCPAGADAALPVHRQDVLRALANLLENAARYAGPGGRVTLAAHLEAGPAAAQGPAAVRFTVTDSGPGFSAEALAKAGTALFTTDAARDGHQGLGLAFAAAVARRHGGTLRAENIPGGARVTLTLFWPGGRCVPRQNTGSNTSAPWPHTGQR